MSAPLPPHESARLASLRTYGVLDSPPEKSFDDLTLLAAHVCGTPIALVSLVDESRQWFKSRIGVSAAETARDVAFCAHTILQQDEVLVVQDATLDPRFKQSPLVTSDPQVRFYAGAPLVAPDGHALGALCVMDRAPRVLSAEQLAALRILSRHVVAELELRRQARALAEEAAERQRAEVQLRQQFEQLAASKAEADRLLELAQKSRRALLSVLEDEKLAGQNLRESEARFRQLAENINDVFWIRDPEKDQLVYVSPAFEKIWARSSDAIQRANQGWLETILAEDQPRYLSVAMSKPLRGQYDETYRIIRPDGSVRWIQDRGYPVCDASGQIHRIVGIAEDITEQKKLEEQFMRTQRLESIGTLASGIAHDLNNVLAPIIMSVAYLKQVVTDAEGLDVLDGLDENVRRGADIIRQVLTFGRGLQGDRVPVQARHLFRDMERIVRETFPKNIRLQFNFPTDLWLAIGDPTQLHQVLLNLCVNARDAMPDGGLLQLLAQNVQLDEQYSVMNPECRPGPYVQLTVRDTGSGIPLELQEKIFEPFFTTKEIGKGTGLGLSSVLAIVKGHGGFIQLQSELGVGSSFEVFFPASPESQPEPGPVERPQLTRGAGQCVLFVDDEPVIRDVASKTLLAYGYEVLTAGDGASAVAVFAQNQARIAAVVTDLMMPVMDGAALAHALRQIRPGVKIITTTGGIGKGATPKLQELDSQHHLAKPYTAEALLTALHRVLNASGERRHPA